MKMQSYATGVAIGSLALLSLQGHAAEITWGTSQLATADTDVSLTTGEVRFAINAGGGNITVNGVDFQGIANPALLGTLIGTAGFQSAIGNGNASAFNAGDLAGTDLGVMFPSAFWGGDQGNIQTLTDLVVGQEYEIQIFSNDARNRPDTFVTMFSNGLDPADPNYVQFAGINKLSNGAPTQGDFIIGTFTADANTQSFEAYGSTDGGVNADSAGRIQINAIQLRAIGEILPLPDGDQNLWTGLNDANLDNTTENFALNNFDEALQSGNLNAIVLDDGEAVFSDEYFALDVATPVTNFDLTIPDTAAPEAGVLSFQSTYSVTSVDAIGIAGSTQVEVADSDLENPDNGGALTLLGTHTYTGSTSVAPDCSLQLGSDTVSTLLSSGTLITNGATTYDTTVEDITFDGSVAGAGTFEKIGPNTLTLTGAGNGFGGTTLLTEGNIVATGNFTGPSIEIGTGTVFDHSFAGNRTISGPITGDGTLKFTGTGGVLQLRSTLAMGPDAMIEVVSGTFKASGAFRGIWTDNQADLDIALDAFFRGDEASVVVDALTGMGNLSTGWNANYNGFTIGAANGSGTYEGTITDTDIAQGHISLIRKVGSGTQTFTGLHTYVGDTVVEEGTLEFSGNADSNLNSSISFYPAATMVSNQARGEGAGTGTLILGGFMDIDTTNTDLTEGNYWRLIDPSNLNVVYGDNFQVTDILSLTNYTESDGVWTYTDGGGVKFSFEEATGVLFIGDPFVIPTDPIRATSIEFNDGILDITFAGLTPGSTYDLNRGTTLLDGFPDTVDTLTVDADTALLSDFDPPAGSAFYKLVEQE